MLVNIGGVFIGIVGDVSCYLQVLERANARCLLAAATALSSISNASHVFEHRLRISTTDQASSNILCEHSLALQMKDEGWRVVHLACDVHVVSRIDGRVFDLMPHHVIGIIRHALSLSSAQPMNLFRKALRMEIRSRGGVRLIVGSPPMEARQRTAFFLRLFANRGHNADSRRILLSLLPNGSWANHQVELYITHDSPLTAAQAEELVANGLVRALAGSMFQTYPRHRWVGHDLAADRCGLLAVCHNLGPGTYKQFMSLIDKSSRSQQVKVPEAREPLLPLTAGEALLEADEELDDAPIVEGDAEEMRGGKNHACNAKNRSIAAAWWAGSPGAALVTMRIVMEPLRQLMQRHLDMSAESFSTKQRHAVLAELEGKPPSPFGQRVTIAASLQLEEECFQQAALLLHEELLWRGLPDRALTVQHRCLCFRLISRMACCVEQLLACSHRRYPTKLFRLLVMTDISIVDEVRTDPDCLKDPWSIRFLSSFPNPRCDEALAVLSFLAELIKCDIAAIECRHAAIRRWVHSRGLQAHSVDLEDLSSEWVCQRARIAAAATTRSAASRGQAEGRATPQRAKRKRRGGGGACRAFFSRQLRARKLHVKQPGVAALLHAEYRALTEEARREYMRDGARATKFWRRAADPRFRHSAFGTVRRRDSTLRAEQDLRVALWRSTKGLSGDEQLAVLQADGALADAGGVVFLKAVADARAFRRMEKKHSEVCRQADVAVYEAWQQSRGHAQLREFVDRVTNDVEERESLLAALAPEPSKHMRLFRFRGDTVNSATKAAAWMHGHQSGQRLKVALLEDWARRHFPILDSESPKLPADTPDAERTDDCRARRTCVCAGAGRLRLRVETQLYRAVKKAFPIGAARDLLKGGYVVCNVFSPRFVERAVCEGAVPPPERGAVCHWWHIGLQYVSPLRSTFAVMVATHEEWGDAPPDARPPRVLLSAQNCYSDCVAALSKLALEREWYVQFYLLEDTLRPIVKMVPGELGAARMDAAPIAVWLPRGARGDADADGDEDPDDDGGAPPLLDGGNDKDDELDSDELDKLLAEAWEADAGPVHELAPEGEAAAGGDHELAGGGDAGDELAPIAGDPPLEAALPPPPPLPGGGGGPAARRGRASAALRVPGGAIYYYEHDGRFTAVCDNALHGSCVLTRSNTRAAGMRGRPLGLMMGFLAVGALHDTKESHWAELGDLVGNHAVRSELRLALSGIPGSGDLLAKERPRDAGEPDEPL